MTPTHATGFNGEFWILSNALVNPQILRQYQQDNPHLFNWLLKQKFIKSNGTTHETTTKLKDYVEIKKKDLEHTLNIIDCNWMIKALLKEPVWPEADIKVWLFWGVIENPEQPKLTELGIKLLNIFALDLINFSIVENEAYRRVLIKHINKDRWSEILSKTVPEISQYFAKILRQGASP
jgi:hypothetical protein